MPPTHQPPFLKSISVHAWNKDRTQLALSPNNHEVWIFDTKGKTDMKDWNKEPIHKLTEHTGYVSAIDWNPTTNLIVTASHDRNAYVFKYEGGEWKPTLVILRINRAATDVKWSPKGDKFAVTSGAKCVPVCHFEEGNNWWISKMIKKHKSTVTSIDWCKNNKLVVTGSTDFKCRIFSAFIEGMDSTDSDEYSSLFPKANEFGECLAEYDLSKGWVDSVSWAPGGFNIAFSGHGSTLHWVDLKTGNSSTVYCKSLPYHKIEFLSDETLLAVGFDSNPTIFTKSGDSWELKGKLDPEEAKKEVKKTGGFGSAFAKFKQADSQGGKGGGGAKEALTFHKNTIEDVKLLKKDGLITEFTTSGVDGRVLFWKASDISGLK